MWDGGRRTHGNSRGGYKKRTGAAEIYARELLACVMPSCFCPARGFAVAEIAGTHRAPQKSCRDYQNANLKDTMMRHRPK